MTPSYRLMVPADVPEVLRMSLRPEDVAELTAQTPGKSIKDILLDAIEITPEPYVVLLDGRIVAIFGLAPPPPKAEFSYGIPWFLSTGEVKLFAKTFLKESRKVIEMFHGEYGILTNLVDSRHTVAIRWLKWLGFTIHDDAPMYPGDPFVKFYQFVRYDRHV